MADHAMAFSLDDVEDLDLDDDDAYARKMTQQGKGGEVMSVGGH
jgi:hypothetical protein